MHFISFIFETFYCGRDPTTLYLTKEQITKVCAKKGEPTCENYKRLSIHDDKKI
jgi:hypothetical protein